MFTSRIRRLLIATLTFAPVLMASQAHAMVVNGNTGNAREGGVSCYVNRPYPNLNRVMVQPPVMSSSPVQQRDTFTVGGGLYGGGFHVQQVGYRAWLYRWNGASWAYTGVVGGLHTGQTGDALQPVGWSDGMNGGSTVFNTPGHGYYRVYLRFYWFADQLSGSGDASGWSTMYENGTQSYCTF
jgi:hypothetical protein